jgi:hypothetical protein
MRIFVVLGALFLLPIESNAQQTKELIAHQKSTSRATCNFEYGLQPYEELVILCGSYFRQGTDLLTQIQSGHIKADTQLVVVSDTSFGKSEDGEFRSAQVVLSNTSGEPIEGTMRIQILSYDLILFKHGFEL